MTTPKPVIRSDQERIVQISGYRIVKLGGGQIEYEDEDPRIHDLFAETLKRSGTESPMVEFIPRLRE